jgi:peptidoglycan/xylan/chitin deacetylase (PgdA/CDA1 family)
VSAKDIQICVGVDAVAGRLGSRSALNGYSDENPIDLSESQEEAVLAKSIELIDKLTGQSTRGYVAPWWEMSERTAADQAASRSSAAWVGTVLDGGEI